MGRMLALAGAPLGLRFVFLDPSPEACARHYGTHIQAAFDDPEALAELARRSDIVTFEFENPPAAALQQVSSERPAFPPAQALHVARDRLNEKTLFQQLSIPTPEFADIASQHDLEAAVVRIGLPALLKTRTLGYDGKGQKLLRTTGDIAGAFAELGEAPCVLEQFIPFSGEVSLLAVRGRSADCAYYPLVSNVHEGGILRSSRPCAEHPLQGLAQRHAEQVMEATDYVGVLAFEFFEHGDRLIANEIAPRVHNSGHWTIEGAQCSQFENHLRAILGWPLGSTAVREHCAMLNLIGSLGPREELLSLPGAHLHDYDKRFAPGRKVGHLTLTHSDAQKLQHHWARAQKLLVG